MSLVLQQSKIPMTSRAMSVSVSLQAVTPNRNGGSSLSFLRVQSRALKQPVQLSPPRSSHTRRSQHPRATAQLSRYVPRATARLGANLSSVLSFGAFSSFSPASLPNGTWSAMAVMEKDLDEPRESARQSRCHELVAAGRWHLRCCTPPVGTTNHQVVNLCPDRPKCQSTARSESTDLEE